MPVANPPVGTLEWVGVLNYLAGVTGAATMGEQWAANAAWPAINGHGAKASTFIANVAGNNSSGTTRWDTLGALNVKNGTVGLGLDHVCNALAGTTNLSALRALLTYAGLA